MIIYKGGCIAIVCVRLSHFEFASASIRTMNNYDDDDYELIPVL